MRTDAVEIPDMPADWWPESLMVVGKSGDCELAFVLPPHLLTRPDYLAPGLRAAMNGLRLSMWQRIALDGPVI